jgi:hypothetical protein
MSRSNFGHFLVATKVPETHHEAPPSALLHICPAQSFACHKHVSVVLSVLATLLKRKAQ